MLRNEQGSEEERILKKPKIVADIPLERLDKKFKYFPFLPADMQRYISGFFLLADYPNIARVSKGFYSLVNGPDFWLNKFRNHYPGRIPFVRRTKNVNWHQVFSREQKKRRLNSDPPTFASIYKGIELERLKNLPDHVGHAFKLIMEGRDDEIDMTSLSMGDLTKLDQDGENLVMLAAERGNQAALDAFYQIALEYYEDEDNENMIDPEATDEAEQTILHWAVLCRQPANMIAALLELGCDVNARDDTDWTPLHCAVMSGHVDAIDLLIARGADPNVMAKTVLPLHMAAYYGQAASMQALIKHRAMINITEGAGQSALQVAAQVGKHACVSILLRYGADVNFISQGGVEHNYGALHHAAKNGHLEIMQVLLAAGANATLRTDNADNGYTALELAIRNGHHECADFLIGHNLDLINQLSHDKLPLLCVAAGSGYINCLRALLRWGADVNAISSTDQYAKHALQQAAFAGDADCLRELIEAGAIIDLETPDGYTALLAAVENGHTACAELLLEHGANPNCRENESGTTALMTAAHEGHLNCLNLLWNYGAEIDKPDLKGRTALFYAVSGDQLKCVKMLCERGADTTLAVNKTEEDLKKEEARSCRRFCLFAPFKNMFSIPTTMTALEFANVEGRHEIANYLEEVRSKSEMSPEW